MAVYDGVILGAGHNGLVTACYLAKARKRVLVLERRPMVGGACVTEEIYPGFRCSTLANSTGPLSTQIVKDLLEDGKIPRSPEGYVVMVKDGSQLQMDESLDALIEVITAELSLGTDGCFTERFQPRWATALIDAVAARGSERDSSSQI